LNSLFSLVVLGMFDLYLRHGSVFRNGLIFIPLLIPIAIFANLCRVLLLTLTTVWFGDAVAQGPVHDTAGLFMFFVALLCLLGLDALLSTTKSLVRR
jgi:exosortase/archaeosortase family protein